MTGVGQGDQQDRPQSPQMQKLSKCLMALNTPDTAMIEFEENFGPEAPFFGTRVRCHKAPEGTARNLAIFFGCDPSKAPSELSKVFMVEDEWTGKGIGTVSELINEVREGSMQFEMQIPVHDIHKWNISDTQPSEDYELDAASKSSAAPHSPARGREGR